MQRAERLVVLIVRGLASSGAFRATGVNARWPLMVATGLIASGTLATAVYRVIWISQRCLRRERIAVRRRHCMPSGGSKTREGCSVLERLSTWSRGRQPWGPRCRVRTFPGRDSALPALHGGGAAHRNISGPDGPQFQARRPRMLPTEVRSMPRVPDDSRSRRTSGIPAPSDVPHAQRRSRCPAGARSAGPSGIRALSAVPLARHDGQMSGSWRSSLASCACRIRRPWP